MAIASAMRDGIHDSSERYNAAEKRTNVARGQDASVRASAALDKYKTLFETELRLWGSIPFEYVTEILKPQRKALDAADVVNVSAGSKLQAIKDTRVPCPYGDPLSLVRGFDSSIRNAGGGHEDWEVGDDGKLILTIRDPRTGKTRRTIRLELSELKDLIATCQRTIWSLQVGFLIFIANEGLQFRMDSTSKDLKVKEIENLVSAFADNRWLSLQEFTFDRERKTSLMTLRHVPMPIANRGQILSMAGAKDIVHVRNDAKLDEQIVGILQFYLSHLVETEYPNVRVKILDSRGIEVCDVEYSADEMRKCLPATGRDHMPHPTTGAVPKMRYYIVHQVLVPVGGKPMAIAFFEERGEDVVSDDEDVDLELRPYLPAE
jgi:hypothetical protein